MSRSLEKTLTLSVLVLLLALNASAKKHRHQGGNSESPGTFDYYLLSLSWAPNYCASHPSDHSSECQIGNHKAFVLHGLWPQAESGPPPKECGPASPVAHEVVDHMLEYMPSAGLVQHEWREHGVCSGLSSRDYFAQAEQAFRSLQIPAGLQSLNQAKSVDVAELERQFSEANRAPKESFRVSCYNEQLVAVEACMDKSLRLRACSRSVRECRAGQVQLEAVK
jgi:ribonuclease T2